MLLPARTWHQRELLRRRADGRAALLCVWRCLATITTAAAAAATAATITIAAAAVAAFLVLKHLQLRIRRRLRRWWSRRGVHSVPLRF